MGAAAEMRSPLPGQGPEVSLSRASTGCDLGKPLPPTGSLTPGRTTEPVWKRM